MSHIPWDPYLDELTVLLYTKTVFISFIPLDCCRIVAKIPFLKCKHFTFSNRETGHLVVILEQCSINNVGSNVIFHGKMLFSHVSTCLLLKQAIAFFMVKWLSLTKYYIVINYASNKNFWGSRYLIIMLFQWFEVNFTP